MKITIPSELKQDIPNSRFGKFLMATPVVMTVIATLLAGLASSEMTRAQYDRALGAQLQSKAGDQWGYFQAKKMRSALQRNSLEILRATVEIEPLTAAQIGATKVPELQQALLQGVVPAPPPSAPHSPALKAALEALESQQAETTVLELVAAVEPAELAAAIAAARFQATAFDLQTKPLVEVIERIETDQASSGTSRPWDKARIRDYSYACIRFNAARYDAEARYNQVIANLLELQVRKANLSAERHHRRSGKFFFGMLGAQAGVIVATFAMAAQKRNLLWSLAAVAGLCAVLFAVYVYLKV